METGCSRVDQARQRIEVGVLELGQLPVLHQQRGKRMSLFGQLLEDAGICGRTRARTFDDRKVQFSKKNLAELWVRIDVELCSRGFVDLPFNSFPLRLKAPFERREPR